jgi:cysteine desulfurase
MTKRLYLDHAATTPVLPQARTAMGEALATWGNPSSPHADGRAARAALEAARERIKAALGWSHEIIFTSGATEAIAIAVTRAVCDAVFVGATEHDAVHRVAPKAYFLPVEPDGRVSPDALTGRLAALGAKAPLVAVQAVNNETGVIQPLDLLIPIVRKGGGLVFADCAQSAAKLDLPDADMIALSAHKFGGPPGIGALLVRDLAMISATGGQERGYRAGTENIPAVLAMSAALDAPRGWRARAADLRAHLDSAIESAGGKVVAREADRVPNIASYHMPGISGNTQLIQFDMAGISVSTGSACSSGSLRASHVLLAMGWDEKPASEVVRASFGPETSRADVYRFIEVWQRLRR